MSVRRLVPLNLPALDSLPTSGRQVGDLVFYNVDQKVYVFDGTDWVIASGSGVTASDSPPDSPLPGEGWFDANTGIFYIFYDGFWVEPSSPNGSGHSGFYAQATQPTSTEPYLWWDTSTPSSPTLWVEDGT